MSFPTQRRVVIVISLLAGGGDLVTGLLLVFVPEWTLARMGIAATPDPVYPSFVGVFVACVGASYGLGLLGWWLGGRLGRLRCVWELTILFRLAAGCFVAAQIMAGRLPWEWSSVPAVDWTWALVQGGGLRAGFFREDYP